MSATLFLVVDAIPFAIAHDTWLEGRMDGFHEPRPMVSVFPSLTNVAVPALLRGVMDIRPPGYEARYYHPPSREIRGGLSEPSAEPGMAPFHDAPEGILSHLAVYALGSPLVQGQARWIGRRFRNSSGPWLGYVAATDAVAHFGGEAKLRAAFGEICDRVVEAADALEQAHGGPAEVVLCSDHGSEFGPLSRLPPPQLEDRLREAGFRPGAVGGIGVVLAPMGEVSGGAAWCSPGAAPELAEALAGMDEIDLAFAATAEGARAFGVRGGRTVVANLKARDGRCRYEPVTGDPLGMLDLFEAVSDSDGWADDRTLFRATADHAYPDAVSRVLGGFRDIVEHPAQVLFSMARGWTFGPKLTNLAAGLMGGQVGTHGALSAAQSRGFAAVRGTSPEVDLVASPAALRSGDVLAPFAARVREGARPPARSSEP